MKAKFIKTGYAVLAALLFTTQLIAAPIALTVEQTEQSVAEQVMPNGECMDAFCGG